MNTQLSLDGIELGEKTDTIFFAAVPDGPAIGHTTEAARTLQRKHGLSGKILPANTFHITLCAINTYDGVPAEIVARAKETAARISVPPFDLVFDRAVSFSGQPGNRPFVLLGSNSAAELKAFRQSFFTALKTYGPKCRAGSSFTPHATLLYDDRMVAEHSIEPVTWKVREFVLVHSPFGQTRHAYLARWPLRG